MATSIVSSSKNTWGFSPQSIPGLAWWLDGADTTSMTFSSGSNISTWKDKSGNGCNATGFNSPQKISTGGVSFNAASSNYFTMNVTYSPSQTMFMVASPVPSTGASQYYINTNPGNKGGIFLGGYNSSFISYYNNTITNFTSGTTTNPFVVSLVKVAGVTSVGTYNGSQAFSIAANTADSATTSWAFLGAAASDANHLTANIYEFIIFNVALPTTQIQQVEGYLAAKWGLTMQLPATHPYSAVVPFLPTQIAGCQLWLDGADSSTITGTSSVTAWTNKGTASGSGSRTAGTFNSTSTTINGVPAMALSSAAVMDMPSITFATTSRSVFLVVTIGARASAYTFVKAGSEQISPQVYSYYLQSDIQLNYSGKNLLVTNADPTNFFNKTSIVSITSEIYVNGTSQALSINNLNSFPFQTGTSTTLSIGGSDTVAYVLGELIIFDGLLTSPQRQQVEQYLGQKWKISVANAPSPGRYLIPTNRPFYPVDIPGCSLWLDAADRSSMTISGTNVTQWNDKSGAGRNVTQATTGYQPTYSSTSNAIVFNQNAFLSIPDALNAIIPAYSIFFVERRASANTMFFMGQFNYNTGNTSLILGYNDSTISHQTLAYISDCQVTISAYAGASEPIRLNRYDYSGTNRDTFINGGQYSTTQAFSATLPVWSNANIGAGYGLNTNSYWYIGNIYEVIFYNNVLTSSQQKQVEQYLAQKWGLVANLPPGHPGKLLPAFSTNFTPKSLTGLALWLDGADSSTITGTSSVTAWANKGTAGGSASTTSGTVSSTSKINNLSVLSFSDSAYMTASILTFTQTTRTAFVVVNIGASGIYRVYLNSSTTVDTQLYNYVNGYTDIEFNYSGRVNYQKQNPSGIFNTTSIICGTLGTNGGIFVTGTSQAPYDINTPGTFGTGTTTTQVVGGGGSFILGEAMIFDGAITAAQRQQVEGYLAWKWGLQSSLPSTHAYAKFSP